MRKQLLVCAVKVTLDPGVPGFCPLCPVSLHDATRLGQPDDFDEVWHVVAELVVDTLLVEDQDDVHFKRLRDVLDLVVALSPDPAASVDDDSAHLGLPRGLGAFTHDISQPGYQPVVQVGVGARRLVTVVVDKGSRFGESTLLVITKEW